MHLPDGFLNSQLTFSLTAVSVIAGSFIVKKVKESLFTKSQVLVPQLVTNIGKLDQSKSVSRWFLKQGSRQKIQQIILVFSIIFVVQMIDLVKINGVPGHVIGSLLAALVLGPWAGALIMSAVLVVQAVFLHDGGIMVLGVNIFNMAIVGCIGGYYIYLGLEKLLNRKSIAIFLASWVSVMAMVLAYAFEAMLVGQSQGISQLIVAHALVGVIEGVFTIFILKFLFDKKYEK